MSISKHFVAGAVAVGIFAAPILSAYAQQAKKPQSQPAQQQAQPQKGETYGDWTLSCEAQGQQKVCAVGQMLTNPKSNKPMLVVEFFYNPQGQPAMQITAPLGVLLRESLKVDIDGKDGGAIPFVWCEPIGCRTVVDLGPDLMDKLKKGQKFNVKYTLVNKQEIAAPVSLKGLSDGLTALSAKK